MFGLQNKAEDDFLPGVTKEKKQSLAIFAVTRYNKLILSTYFYRGLRCVFKIFGSAGL